MVRGSFIGKREIFGFGFRESAFILTKQDFRELSKLSGWLAISPLDIFPIQAGAIENFLLLPEAAIPDNPLARLDID